MKKTTLALGLFAAAVLTTTPLAASAMPPEGMGPPHGAGMPGGGPHMGLGMHSPMFQHLDLSESQQDQIFEIRHAQEPAMRNKGKEMHKAHEALRKLARSDDYSDAKAKALADTLGRVGAEMALLHATTERKIMQVLTPEQRRRLEQQGMPHGRPDERPAMPPAAR